MSNSFKMVHLLFLVPEAVSAVCNHTFKLQIVVVKESSYTAQLEWIFKVTGFEKSWFPHTIINI